MGRETCRPCASYGRDQSNRGVPDGSYILESLTRSCDRIHLLAGGVVAGTFRPAEFDRLDALMLSGATGEKLDMAHRLIAHHEARR